MAIADTLDELGRDSTTLRSGQVTALNGQQVDVTVSGGSMTLPRLSWYTPAVGDQVLILPSQIGWVVLGKVAT